MFTSIARTLAVVLVAASTAACAVAADDGSSNDVTPPATTAVGSAESAPGSRAAETPEALLADMGESLVESLLGHAFDSLFPSPTIDYERLAHDYQVAAHQANVDQTVWSQQGVIQGKMDTLNDLEVRYQRGSQTRADALDTYASIDSQWEDINGSIETLSQPEIASAGLGAWIAGAQIKLSMIGELIVLDPDRADGNKGLLFYNTKNYFAHLTDTKSALIQAAVANRTSQIHGCYPYRTGGGQDPRYVFDDVGTGQQHLGFSYDEPTCEAKRNTYVSTTQASFLGQEAQDLKFLDDTLKGWQKIIEVGQSRIIDVTSATYGASCGAAKDNALMLTGLACNTKEDCEYAISIANLGDPAPGCAKDFQVSYTCVNDPMPHTVTIPAEANGKTVQLACL